MIKVSDCRTEYHSPFGYVSSKTEYYDMRHMSYESFIDVRYKDDSYNDQKYTWVYNPYAKVIISTEGKYILKIKDSLFMWRYKLCFDTMQECIDMFDSYCYWSYQFKSLVSFFKNCKIVGEVNYAPNDSDRDFWHEVYFYSNRDEENHD